MSETESSNLKAIFALSVLDGEVVKLERQRKRAENEINQQREILTKKGMHLQSQMKIVETRRLGVAKEEKEIKEEQDKLVARRKALATMNNYKVQQAAEREVEGAAQHIATREEVLLQAMEDLETLQKTVAGLRKEFEKEKSEYDAYVKDATGMAIDIDHCIGKKMTEREGAISAISSADLGVYDKVRQKHQDSPVALLKLPNLCGACSMTVGPQIIVQIARGTALVKCPGCGRILYLDESAELKE